MNTSTVEEDFKDDGDDDSDGESEDVPFSLTKLCRAIDKEVWTVVKLADAMCLLRFLFSFF
jgi:hypothetical protein